MKLYSNFTLNNTFFRTTLYFSLFCFIFSLSGCVTTDTVYITENAKKPVKKDYEIVSLLLRTGQKIFTKGTTAKFFQSYKEKSNVVVYYLYDTTIVSENDKKIAAIEKIIEFKDIESAKVEITNVNTGVTILLILSPFILYGLYYLFFFLLYALGGGHSG